MAGYLVLIANVPEFRFLQLADVDCPLTPGVKAATVRWIDGTGKLAGQQN